MRTRRRVRQEFKGGIEHLMRRGRITRDALKIFEEDIADALKKENPAKVGNIIKDLIELSKEGGE